jgi:hypothetical protein
MNYYNKMDLILLKYFCRKDDDDGEYLSHTMFRYPKIMNSEPAKQVTSENSPRKNKLANYLKYSAPHGAAFSLGILASKALSFHKKRDNSILPRAPVFDKEKHKPDLWFQSPDEIFEMEKILPYLQFEPQEEFFARENQRLQDLENMHSMVNNIKDNLAQIIDKMYHFR